MFQYCHTISILRILACLMVIFMHAPLPSEQTDGIFLSTLSYLTAPCIGLFFMVSGYLLLPIHIHTEQFIKKRLNKVIFPTLFWSLFYLGANAILQQKEINWLHSIFSLPFSTQGNPVLWFMYTLIGLYLLAPIISRWIENASRKEMEFYLGLWGISLCYPILSSFLSINQGTTGILYYFTGYAGYFILGSYLKKYPERISFKCIIPLMGIAILAPIICKIAQINVNFYEVFWYLSIFVVIQCVFWFQTITKLPLKFSNRIETMLTRISNLSFGIYLIHIFIMRYILWECDFIQNMNSYILQTVTIAVLTFVLSTIACYLISWLPFSAYVIGYKSSKQ